jgi:hypothetical protein
MRKVQSTHPPKLRAAKTSHKARHGKRQEMIWKIIKFEFVLFMSETSNVASMSQPQPPLRNVAVVISVLDSILVYHHVEHLKSRNSKVEYLQAKG